MKEIKLYGTLVCKNEDDTTRTYFVIECVYWEFYIHMFVNDWNMDSKKSCERNGLKGFNIILHRKIR